MPIPEQRDLEAARDILAAWLAKQLSDADDVRVGTISGPASTGFSNETLLFDASGQRGGNRVTDPLPLRAKPTPHTVILHPDFEQQYPVVRTLGGRPHVPVP